MKSVVFKFGPGEKVRTPFGDGIVLICCLNRGGVQEFLVRRFGGHEWWIGEDLTPRADLDPIYRGVPTCGGYQPKAPEEPPNQVVRENQPSPPDSE
jgi:hypothetical protein